MSFEIIKVCFHGYVKRFIQTNPFLVENAKRVFKGGSYILLATRASNSPEVISRSEFVGASIYNFIFLYFAQSGRSESCIFAKICPVNHAHLKSARAKTSRGS